MGFLQNQNQTLGSSQPEVSYWESTTQPSPAVTNTVIVLGVLTFALQLCLALLFMLRCWRLDNRVREALKHPDVDNKLHGIQFLLPDIYKHPTHQICEDAAGLSPVGSETAEKYEDTTEYWRTPSIPWDLVQS